MKNWKIGNLFALKLDYKNTLYFIVSCIALMFVVNVNTHQFDLLKGILCLISFTFLVVVIQHDRNRNQLYNIVLCFSIFAGIEVVLMELLGGIISIICGIIFLRFVEKYNVKAF